MRISTIIVTIIFALILPTMLLSESSHCSCGVGRGASSAARSVHSTHHAPTRPFMMHQTAAMTHQPLSGEYVSYTFDPNSFIHQVIAGLGLSFIIGFLYNCWRSVRRWLMGLWSATPCSHPWQTHEWSLSERLICVLLAAITTWLVVPSWVSMIMCIGSTLIYFRNFHNDRAYRAGWKI